jgi:hypothetical protein
VTATGGEQSEGPPDQPIDAGGRRSAPAFVALAAVLVLAGLGLGLGLSLSGGSASSGVGPEGVPLEHAPDLASADTTASGAPVDGITCRTAAQQVVNYHIHVHLNVFVKGKLERIPPGAGIPLPRLEEHFPNGLFFDNSVDGCLYWLHVHTADGIIHVESPIKATFTLGQFFDIWQQPLGPDQVGPARGTVVAFENGKRVTGDPRTIPLLPHAVIQLDVGSPVVPFEPVQFHVSGLCSTSSQGCAA